MMNEWWMMNELMNDEWVNELINYEWVNEWWMN